MSTLLLVCDSVEFWFVYNDLAAEQRISGAGRRGDRLALHAPPRFRCAGSRTHPCLPLGEGADRREADEGRGALSYCKANGDCSLSLIRPRFAGPPVPTLFVPSGHFPLIGGIGPQGKALGAVLHSTHLKAPGSLRGRSPFSLGKSPEETLPKGFLWRLLSFAKRFLSCTRKKENA